MMTNNRDGLMSEIREIVLEVLELDEEEVTETSLFIDDHGADSLLAIEILARLEKRFDIVIPQEELEKMTHLAAVYEVVTTCAGQSD
jgi:acyl carrier protein